MTKAKHMELISMEEPFLTTEATTVFFASFEVVAAAVFRTVAEWKGNDSPPASSTPGLLIIRPDPDTWIFVQVRAETCTTVERMRPTNLILLPHAHIDDVTSLYTRCCEAVVESIRIGQPGHEFI
jgi:hypothetical protein